MVKPTVTHNMTITLPPSGSVKPLVVSQDVLVHANVTPAPILPHQPIASEQDRAPQPRAAISLEKIAGFSLSRPAGDVKLRDFTREQVNLLTKRYTITQSD